MTEHETMWYGDNMWKHSNVQWEYKFCWFPKRCHLSRNQLWLKMAYCGTIMIKNGSGNPIVEYCWHDTNEHLIWLLKG